MLLMVRELLLMLMVLPGVGVLWRVMLWVVGAVACDVPGDADAGDALIYGVAGDANGEACVGRWCSVLGCRWW